MKGKNGRGRRGKRGVKVSPRMPVDPKRVQGASGIPHQECDEYHDAVLAPLEPNSELNEQSPNLLSTILPTPTRSAILNKAFRITPMYPTFLKASMASLIMVSGGSLLNRHLQNAEDFMVDPTSLLVTSLFLTGMAFLLAATPFLAFIASLQLLFASVYCQFMEIPDTPGLRAIVLIMLISLSCVVIVDQVIEPMVQNLDKWSRQVSGASQDRVRLQESLRRVLSSRRDREMLQLLPSREAVMLINNMEQALGEDPCLCLNDRRKYSMMLTKMCYHHERLPRSYIITGELERIGECPVGRGGNADVWFGRYRGFPVAIKVLRMYAWTDIVDWEKKFCREAVIWKQFKHPNLLSLVGTEKISQTLMMVSEWMEHGTVMDFVNAFPATNRLKLLADISRGLKYLHEWPSVHADLKGSNILVDGNHTARIGDFGLASLLRHPSITMSVGPPVEGGTLQWMAPELFVENPHPSKESDIYALGMVSYEILAHQRPFSREAELVVPGLVRDGKRPPRPMNRDILGLSEDVWVLIEQCWDADPRRRPQIATILVQFEAASRDWVSPTLEEIANLSLDLPTDTPSESP